MATLSFGCGHKLATFVHVRPGGPGHDQPPPQEPGEPTAPGNPCAPGALAPERPKPGLSALGGAWAPEAMPPGPHVHLSRAGRVLPSQVYQEEETIGLQHAFSVAELAPSLAAAPNPHSGRTWDRPSPPPLPPGVQPCEDAGCGRGPQMACPELAPRHPASLPPAPLTLSFRPPSVQRLEQGTRPPSWPVSPSAPPTGPSEPAVCSRVSGLFQPSSHSAKQCALPPSSGQPRTLLLQALSLDSPLQRS